MAQLYPPYIEGKLPAQTGDVLRIPFQLNRAQGPTDLAEARVKALVKQVNTGIQILKTLSEINFKDCYQEGDIYYAVFNIDPQEQSNLNIGQYYKIQLAFISESSIGIYYSGVGIFKYTSLPEVSIDKYNSNSINPFLAICRGKYTNTDLTEKVLEYKFDLWSDDGLIESSGWRLHTLDTEDAYSFESQLKELQYYTLSYTIKTINNLIVSSPVYTIYGGITLDNNLEGKCVGKVQNNADIGAINIYFQSNTQDLIRGTYRILRSDGTKVEVIDEIIIDKSFGSEPELLFQDFTVEQGVQYTYSLQQYDKSRGLITKPFELGTVYSNFEDCFLADEERQLNIRFNPQISSFKTTILESKQDTIGDTYPHFMRNGHVSYKEFPISGLISLHMDEQSLFINRPEAEFNERVGTPADQFIDKNDEIAQERLFKLEVLNWLNNGKPKSFRSPTEGNYIVRLMGVSLAPNTTLGRMLHTFSATAYEIAPYTIKALHKNQVVKKNQNILNEIKETEVPLITNTQIENAIQATVFGYPNAVVTCVFEDNQEQFVTIGDTGEAEVRIDKGNALVGASYSLLNLGDLTANQAKNHLGDSRVGYTYKIPYDTILTIRTVSLAEDLNEAPTNIFIAACIKDQNNENPVDWYPTGNANNSEIQGNYRYVCNSWESQGVPQLSQHQPVLQAKADNVLNIYDMSASASIAANDFQVFGVYLEDAKSRIRYKYVEESADNYPITTQDGTTITGITYKENNGIYTADSTLPDLNSIIYMQILRNTRATKDFYYIINGENKTLEEQTVDTYRKVPIQSLELGAGAQAFIYYVESITETEQIV